MVCGWRQCAVAPRSLQSLPRGQQPEEKPTWRGAQPVPDSERKRPLPVTAGKGLDAEPEPQPLFERDLVKGPGLELHELTLWSACWWLSKSCDSVRVGRGAVTGM